VIRIGRMAAFICLMCFMSGAAVAQGKVAVLNLEEAIFNTEEAKAQFASLEQTADFAENKRQAETLKKKYDDLVAQFNKNREVMSDEQEADQATKIKQVGTDLDFVVKKLQQSQRDVAQRVMREMGQRANTVVMDLVKAEGIGLLLNGQAAYYADNGYNINAKVTDKLNQLKK
jgi:outer membrane protein